MHQSRVTQTMPLRLLNELTLGLRSSRQRRPSNDSVKVDTTWPLACWPTATQNDSSTHETLARLAKRGPAVGVTVHAWPSQVSTYVCGAPPRVVPTATQNRSDAQDTPERTFDTAGLPFGVTRHARPSQISINPWLPPAVKWLPTATQNDADTHDTPERLLWRSAGLDVGAAVHDVPSQCSTSVWLTSCCRWLPTATQNVDETHETPTRSAVPGRL